MGGSIKFAAAVVLAGLATYACIAPTAHTDDDRYSSLPNPTVDVPSGTSSPSPNDTPLPTSSPSPSGSATPPKAITINVLAARDPNYSVGPDSKYNAVADFDGDGHLDVVVSNNVLNNIRLYKKPGIDANVPFVATALDDRPRHVTAVDLDGDSAVDLAVVTNQNVIVLLNNGDGTFAPATHHALTGPGGYRVVSADLDGDTYPDLVAGGMNDALCWFKNDGHGAFGNATAVPMVTTGRADVNAADINGDGKPDLIAVTLNPVAMNVFINQGGGTFAAPVTYAYVTSGHTVALSDVNGDGYRDVAISDSGQTLTVALNDGHGNFTNHQVYTLDAGVWPDDIGFGDLNGDGLADLVMSTWTGRDVTVLLNEGGGMFGSAQHFSLADRNWQVQVADVNGDGKPDIVSSTETYNLAIMLNTTP